MLLNEAQVIFGDFENWTDIIVVSDIYLKVLRHSLVVDQQLVILVLAEKLIMLDQVPCHDLAILLVELLAHYELVVSEGVGKHVFV